MIPFLETGVSQFATVTSDRKKIFPDQPLHCVEPVSYRGNPFSSLFLFHSMSFRRLWSPHIYIFFLTEQPFLKKKPFPYTLFFDSPSSTGNEYSL